MGASSENLVHEMQMFVSGALANAQSRQRRTSRALRGSRFRQGKTSAGLAIPGFGNSNPGLQPKGVLRTESVNFASLSQSSRSLSASGIRFVAASAPAPAATVGPSSVEPSVPAAAPKKASGGRGGGPGARLREGLPDDVPITRHPTWDQLVANPVAFFRYVPKDLALFLAGAVAGGAAKSVTAPLDRVKLMMQVQSVQVDAAKKKTIQMLPALMKILQEEGASGLWKGNLPQVIRVIPYSAVQLFAYETYKRVFQGTDNELSVLGRLGAGACAGMTSTLVTYPLDTLRLRLAVDPASKSMSQVFVQMLRQEGVLSFYRGLAPSLLGIAPYIALNFCVFDLLKKSIPEEYRNRPEASFVTALASATFATVMCYPLDTVRRQMQLKGTPYKSVLEAFPGIIAKDGVVGLYRGFLANALKNLPNASIRLTTYDAAKNLIRSSRKEFDKLVAEPPKATT